MSRRIQRYVRDLARTAERVEVPEEVPAAVAAREAVRRDLVGLSILEAMDRPGVFGRFFTGPTWDAWRAVLAALFGLPLDAARREVLVVLVGHDAPLAGPYPEAWAIAGRRGGKSRVAALVAVYLACFRDYAEVLAPGERGTVPVLAADRRQARTVYRYVLALLDAVPALRALVARRRLEGLELLNGVSIEIHTASFRSIRGYTVVGAIADEVAFWSDEGTNPDAEVLAALRPAMATVPGAVLLAITTPYARRGEAWRAFDRYHGVPAAPVLVVRAPTLALNPTVSPAVIARAREDDPLAAAAEYDAEFRRDVEAFVAPEALEAATVPGRAELPPVAGVEYLGFVDPSGGSRDSYALAVAHHEDGRAVLDAVRERRPPFSPDDVTAEYAALLQAYGCARVVGDRYGGEWPRERFRAHGVTYEPAAKSKSDLYREVLAPLNAGRVELLDHRRLRAQLEGLERRTARGGRDTVDHPPGGFDDLANAAAGALVGVLERAARPAFAFAGDAPRSAAEANEEARAEYEDNRRLLEEAVRERGILMDPADAFVVDRRDF